MACGALKGSGDLFHRHREVGGHGHHDLVRRGNSGYRGQDEGKG
jgi:hypothetical protein